MTEAVEAYGLTKRFRGTLAVHDLSFVAPEGSVCALLGPNGAGKTTTLRMLLGLVHPTSGSGALLGQPSAPGAKVLHRVGTLVERPGFVPHLSGERNLRLWWAQGGASWPPPGLDRALDVAGLGAALGRRVKTYSQGMRQRLGIAQALLGNPELLVLDEPTNGLDPHEMRTIRGLLRGLSSDGTTVLLSSHLLGEVEDVATDVVVMDHGRLVASGPVATVVGDVSSVYVEVTDVALARTVLSKLRRLGPVTDDPPGLRVTLGARTRSEVVAALVRGKVGVETVTAKRRLEEAYLDLVGGDPQ